MKQNSYSCISFLINNEKYGKDIGKELYIPKCITKDVNVYNIDLQKNTETMKLLWFIDDNFNCLNNKIEIVTLQSYKTKSEMFEVNIKSKSIFCCINGTLECKFDNGEKLILTPSDNKFVVLGYDFKPSSKQTRYEHVRYYVKQGTQLLFSTEQK